MLLEAGDEVRIRSQRQLHSALDYSDKHKDLTGILLHNVAQGSESCWKVRPTGASVVRYAKTNHDPSLLSTSTLLNQPLQQYLGDPIIPEADLSKVMYKMTSDSVVGQRLYYQMVRNQAEPMKTIVLERLVRQLDH